MTDCPTPNQQQTCHARQQRIKALKRQTGAFMLGMLFVDPEYMRQGVGRQLWEFGQAHIERCFPKLATVELNSSPHAVAF